MGPHHTTQTLLLATTLLLVCGLPALSAAEAKSLELGLVSQASGLIEHFKANKHHNVGVLKFLIQREGEKTFSDNVGTMNMLAARRLEVALVLANDNKATIGVIRNASAVAARTKGANHRTPGGRKKLFEPNYSLAWGKPPEQVRADAFVTGAAQISKDLRSLTISLFVFDKTTNKLSQVGEDFTVRNDAGKLAEMNQSFLLRGLFDDGKAVLAAAQVAQEKEKHPLTATTPPVGLDVLYNGKPVKIEHRNGKAFLLEPSEGQKVAFRLRRDGSKVRYGVVLKVNGENTIDKEHLPDLQCRRWILDPGSAPITIAGYQISDRTAEQFRVLSQAESKVREMNYGADVGTISLTVFPERQKEESYDPTEEKNKRNERVVMKGTLPLKDSFKDLKRKLLEESNEEESRGLIGEGEKIASRVRVVSFKPAPTPVMSVTLIYYRP